MSGGDFILVLVELFLICLKGIIVKVVTKKLGEKYHKKKGEIKVFALPFRILKTPLPRLGLIHARARQ